MTVTTHVLDRLEDRVGELIAARDSTRTDFTAYRDRPTDFMREILGFHPWEKQVEVCRAVLEGKRTVVRGHHGAGKDAVLAALLLWACYAREMLSIVVSATERQLLGQVWAELARLWTDAGVFAGELYVGELRIGGEKRIVAMTSGSTSRLTGWHNHRGTGVFVAISESQAEHIGEVAFDAAEGNTAGEGSRIVVVGNPVKPQGRFYEVSRKPTWKAIRISAFDHPNIVEGRVVIPGGPAPGWPEDVAAEYGGTDSAFYVSRVLGEFPTEGSVDSLIRREWVEAAFERHEAGLALKGYPLPLLALDVARSLDRDENVAAVVQGPAVHALHAWRVRDLTVTADRFLDLADRTRLAWYAAGDKARVDESSPVVKDPAKLARWLSSIGVPDLELWIDAPGVGSGVVDDCRRRGRGVTEWWGWVPAKDEKRFANLRAAAYWRYRGLLENGEIALPRDRALADELVALEWSQDAKGRVVMIAKEELRKALGRSPDRADVTCIGLAASMGAVPQPTVSFESLSI